MVGFIPLKDVILVRVQVSQLWWKYLNDSDSSLEPFILVRVQVPQPKIVLTIFLSGLGLEPGKGSGNGSFSCRKAVSDSERWKTVGFQGVKIPSPAARKFGIIFL